MVKRYSIQSYKKRGVKVLKSVPRGWKKIRMATTAPLEYCWYSNGRSRFEPGYMHALVRRKK